MVETFATDFHQSMGIPLCPNGDQVRSDDEGLFCWLDGERVSYPIAPEPVKRALSKKAAESEAA